MFKGLLFLICNINIKIISFYLNKETEEKFESWIPYCWDECLYRAISCKWTGQRQIPTFSVNNSHDKSGMLASHDVTFFKEFDKLEKLFLQTL